MKTLLGHSWSWIPSEEPRTTTILFKYTIYEYLTIENLYERVIQANFKALLDRSKLSKSLVVCVIAVF